MQGVTNLEYIFLFVVDSFPAPRCSQNAPRGHHSLECSTRGTGCIGSMEIQSDRLWHDPVHPKRLVTRQGQSIECGAVPMGPAVRRSEEAVHGGTNIPPEYYCYYYTRPYFFLVQGIFGHSGAIDRKVPPPSLLEQVNKKRYA